VIDLRSDTVTKPSATMRAAMAEAAVGDDVYHGDPTVNRLEETVAELLGKDAAVYVPTGTMSNQVALRIHTEPGDVVLAATDAHIAIHEVGAPAALSGLTIQLFPSPFGVFSAPQVAEAIPQPDPAMPSSIMQPVTLLCAENTHNAAGGTIWPLDTLVAAAAAGSIRGLGTHLDGARLWNASAATGTAERTYAQPFDTVSVCFSKGLGAPVGSALAGSAELIERARRFKQMFGGGFRQAGILAAGALYALEHHRAGLVDDHEHARRFARAVADMPGITVEMEAVQTNMVYFGVASPVKFAAACRAAGVDMLAADSESIRAVFHRDVTAADTARAIDVVAAVAGDPPG
jgi:threonine aldolase